MNQQSNKLDRNTMETEMSINLMQLRKFRNKWTMIGQHKQPEMTHADNTIETTGALLLFELKFHLRNEEPSLSWQEKQKKIIFSSQPAGP